MAKLSFDFFFIQEIRHGPCDFSDKPGSEVSLEDFLSEAKFTVNKSLVRSVKSSSRLIYCELKKMLDKMPWIQRKAKGSVNMVIERHVEEIVQFQELTCGLLSQEAEAKRRDEPAANPVIPRGKLVLAKQKRKITTAAAHRDISAQ